jgi:hypothetical protein
MDFFVKRKVLPVNKYLKRESDKYEWPEFKEKSKAIYIFVNYKHKNPLDELYENSGILVAAP